MMKVNLNNTSDKKLFEKLGQENRAGSGIFLTVYGMKKMLDLNKSALKMLSYLCYNVLCHTDIDDRDRGVVYLPLPEEGDILDRDGTVILTYQNYRRGVKGLIDCGFLLKADKSHGLVAGREWRWYYNPEYFSLVYDASVSLPQSIESAA